jgi:hypothetical protein
MQRIGHVLSDDIPPAALVQDGIPAYPLANSKASLDPESVKLKLSDSTLHVKVAKAKKKRLEVKKSRRR